MGIIEQLQKEEALITTANAMHAELQKPEVRTALPTFKIVSLEVGTESTYGNYVSNYDLIVPDPKSNLHPILVTGGEIIYLEEETPGTLRKALDNDLPEIYEAIGEERPKEHASRVDRGGTYDSSAPCTIRIFGTRIHTQRDTQTTNVEEFLGRLADANETVLKIREEQHYFRRSTGENPFQRRAREIRERDDALNSD